MKPFIVIRQMNKSDEQNCQELIKQYIMSYASDAFISCLFREITLQLIVLLWAVMFIFIGIPLIFCVTSIPIVIAVLFVCIYTTYYNKAIEMGNESSQYCWVAVAYEPYFMRTKPKDIIYDIVDERMVNDDIQMDMKKMKPTMVGTVSLSSHIALYYANWIHRLAIHPQYQINQFGDIFVDKMLTCSKSNEIYAIETSLAECQSVERDFLITKGFKIKQIYQKSLLGGSLRIMRSQMSIDLSELSELVATS